MTPNRDLESDRWTSGDLIDRVGDATELVVVVVVLIVLWVTAPLWLTSAAFRRWLMRALDWVLA